MALGGQGAGVVPEAATDSNAASSSGGSARPRRDARRKIPWQAFGLKEYLCRCAPVVSKTSDNDDSTAALGDSEMASVQHSVGEPIPALSQGPEDGSHVPSSPR